MLLYQNWGIYFGPYENGIIDPFTIDSTLIINP